MKVTVFLGDLRNVHGYECHDNIGHTIIQYSGKILRLQVQCILILHNHRLSRVYDYSV